VARRHSPVFGTDTASLSTRARRPGLAGAPTRSRVPGAGSRQDPGYVPRVRCTVFLPPFWVVRLTGTFRPGLSSASTVESAAVLGVASPAMETITSPARIPAFAAGPPDLTELT